MKPKCRHGPGTIADLPARKSDIDQQFSIPTRPVFHIEGARPPEALPAIEGAGLKPETGTVSIGNNIPGSAQDFAQLGSITIDHHTIGVAGIDRRITLKPFYRAAHRGPRHNIIGVQASVYVPRCSAKRLVKAVGRTVVRLNYCPADAIPVPLDYYPASVR